MTLAKFTPGFALRDSMFPNSFTKALDNLMEDAFGSVNVNFKPTMDVKEDDTCFTYEVSLPGMKKEEITIDLKNDVLTVSGERKLEKKENGKVHHVESYYGAFTRSFTLPENIKAEGIKAEFKNGILHITVPKGDVSKPKAIEIL